MDIEKYGQYWRKFIPIIIIMKMAGVPDVGGILRCLQTRKITLAMQKIQLKSCFSIKEQGPRSLTYLR